MPARHNLLVLCLVASSITSSACEFVVKVDRNKIGNVSAGGEAADDSGVGSPSDTADVGGSSSIEISYTYDADAATRDAGYDD